MIKSIFQTFLKMKKMILAILKSLLNMPKRRIGPSYCKQSSSMPMIYLGRLLDFFRTKILKDRFDHIRP